jgi:hypothetical protein
VSLYSSVFFSSSIALASAQDRSLHFAVGATYAATRFEPGAAYLGFGGSFTYMPTQWIGARVEAVGYPHERNLEDQLTASNLSEFGGVVFVGHRWRPVAAYIEAGGGISGTLAYVDFRPATGQADYANRNYKDVILGAWIDVPVSRRWSLAFEGRDNLNFIAPYQVYVYSLNAELTAPGGTVNSPEARMTVYFHF